MKRPWTLDLWGGMKRAVVTEADLAQVFLRVLSSLGFQASMGRAVTRRLTGGVVREYYVLGILEKGDATLRVRVRVEPSPLRVLLLVNAGSEVLEDVAEALEEAGVGYEMEEGRLIAVLKPASTSELETLLVRLVEALEVSGRS